MERVNATRWMEEPNEVLKVGNDLLKVAGSSP